MGQGIQNSTFDNYPGIEWLGIGTTGESGINFNVGGTVAVSPTTSISSKYKLTSNRGPNAQSLKSSDLNPFQGQNYYTHNLKWGIVEKLKNGDEVFGKWEIQNTPLSNETTIGIGYQSNNTKATIEHTNIHATHVFGPTDQSIIRANIEGRINKNTEWFAGIEKWGIEDKKIQAGIRFQF